MVSSRLQFVELRPDGSAENAGYAPYLDYAPVTDEEHELLGYVLEQGWLSADVENQVESYAIEHIVPDHLREVRQHVEERADKTHAAV